MSAYIVEKKTIDRIATYTVLYERDNASAYLVGTAKIHYEDGLRPPYNIHCSLCGYVGGSKGGCEHTAAVGEYRANRYNN